MNQNDVCRKEEGPHPASAPAIRGVSEPIVFTDEGIRQWVAEHEQQAKGIPHSDTLHSAAVLTLCYLRNIITRLDHSPATVRQQLEKRRQELLRESRTDWHERKPLSEPPLELLRANAERQAYCEVRADVMELVQRIVALSKKAAAPSAEHRIHHRPVKRIR